MNHILAAKIQAMAQADQAMRNNAINNDAPWDSSLDKLHTKRLKKIIERYGWPSFSLVGPQVSNDAWLLVQHADHDAAFQEECLRLMKALPAGEVRLANIAYLEDRILVGRGKLQLYGTQFMGVGKDLAPQPIKDETHLDERREAMKLGPFADYKKLMFKEYGDKG
ncbi:MAG TPA: DUF6624 domain-containing protein [Candidatus Saccharimonadales bacterium]|nr:DUF6624 domain-containing protein [Candidatus Saccharimonadales bacterium]